jgi:uncharacterized protein
VGCRVASGLNFSDDLPMRVEELPIAVDSGAIAEFCRARGIRKLSVFGSVLREDFDPARSDVDVLVEFLPGRKPGWEFFGWAEDLSQILGRKVDLCSRLSPQVEDAVQSEALTLYEQA